MTDQGPDISVIVATYNGTDQLARCVQSLSASGDAGIEVVIADDGSSNTRTAEVIEDFRRGANFRVTHAWQEDDGFRLARSRNNAVHQSRGQFLLFLDHDLVLPPSFFKILRKSIQQNWFVGGRRVKLDENTSNQIMSGEMPEEYLFTLRFRLEARRRRLKRWRYLFPSRDRGPGSTPQPYRGMSGFCIGAWRRDFDLVDGFDDRYRGYGAEDWDFMARLTNAGVHAGYLPWTATMLHLWHNETPVPLDSPAFQMLEEVEMTGTVKAQLGYSSFATASSDEDTKK